MSLFLNHSYSSMDLLNECERKYEIEKLLAPEGIGENSLDLVAGSAFGVGLEVLLETGSVEKAIWQAYLQWTFPLRGRPGIDRVDLIEGSRSITEATKKKSFFYVSRHLQKAEWTLRDNEHLQGFRLWILPSGRPAVEVGFRIKLPNGNYHRGFLDAILVKDLPDGTKQYACLEIKTSGFTDANPAYWQNSAQGNAYAFIVDYLTGQVNPVMIYLIAEFPQMGQQVFDFWKGPADKLSWIPALAIDIARIEMMLKAKHFPMRGKSCMSYFRPCKYLGVCNLTRTEEWKAHKEEPDSAFDFNFTLQELMTARDKLYGTTGTTGTTQ